MRALACIVSVLIGGCEPVMDGAWSVDEHETESSPTAGGAAEIAMDAAAPPTAFKPRSLVAEGDSLTFRGGPDTYVNQFVAHADPTLASVATLASGGSTIASVEGRTAAVDSMLHVDRQNILSVLIGTNDNANGTPAQTFLMRLAAYLDARRERGWIVVAITVPPTSSTVAAHFAWRDTVNTQIRSWVGVHCDAVSDFAADPTMGAPSAPLDPTLYHDGIHQTPAGHAALELVYRETINSLPQEEMP